MTLDSMDRVLSALVTRIGRMVYKLRNIDSIPKEPGGYDHWNPTKSALDHQDANLVSSELEVRGEHGLRMHAPAIDIDVPCYLVPSSTTGHFHLYIEKPMTWPVYYALLQALAEAGVVEPGFVEAARIRQASFLRLPHIKKKAS